MNRARRRLLFLLSGLPSLADANVLIDLVGGTGMYSNTPTNFGPRVKSLQDKLDSDRVIQIPNFEEFILLNTHTEEELVVSHGNVREYKNRLDNLLRDWRRNETYNMDMKICSNLIAICAISRTVGAHNVVRIHSGYRTKITNDSLRVRNPDVAFNSYHTRGKAIDFSIDGLPTQELFKIARKNIAGGVGLYENFIHIDSGPQRTWGA